MRISRGLPQSRIPLPFEKFHTMIGINAFDPDSGAPLSEERYYYPGQATRSKEHAVEHEKKKTYFTQGARVPVYHPEVAWSDDCEGRLTNGKLCSSTMGILGYFRRIHRRALDEPIPAMDRSAALAVKQLNGSRETGGDWDCYIWYALAERLAKKGYETRWMFDYADPRCPRPSGSTRCGSMVKYRSAVSVEKGGTFLETICASEPNRHGSIDDAIRERVGEIYEGSFDESFDPAHL